LYLSIQSVIVNISLPHQQRIICPTNYLFRSITGSKQPAHIQTGISTNRKLLKNSAFSLKFSTSAGKLSYQST